MSKVAVLSAGSWGTAFSLVLADAGNDVAVWTRRDSVAENIQRRHENPDYFPGVQLPVTITAGTNPERILHDAEFVVLSVPSQTLRENLGTWIDLIPRSAILISLMKGVELGTTQRMSEVIAEVADVPLQRIGVVSGPNLAGEIIRREPAASVVACQDDEVARQIQLLTHTKMFRPYRSTDVVGCELGGAYKNVIALCVGMAVGLGYGDNTTASIITRGLAETARLATALGAEPLTLMGLAGLGDLVATCSSPLSRNRSFGELLGKGMTVEEIYASTNQVAEGAKSCSSILALAHDTGVYAPIAQHVDAVIRGDLSAADMVVAFNSGETKREIE